MKKDDLLKEFFLRVHISPDSLTKYAIEGHGFMDEDGHWGVVYPDDLDEYERETLGDFIPEGYLEICFWDGQYQSMHCKKSDYLDALKAHLTREGKTSLIKSLDNI